MRKLLCYIVFFFCGHSAIVSSAQAVKDVALDTVLTVTEVPVSESIDTTRFDPIWLQDPVASRNVPQRILDSLKADDDYWYANLGPAKKELAKEPTSNKKSWFRQQWFRSLLWFAILGSFIGVVIWYLISSNILLFRKKAKNIAAVEEEAVVTDDIFSIHYDAEIAKAAGGGNYRLAVRLWYLYLLKELAEKGLIDYRYGRTNHDYVMQLHKSAYYRDFSRITRNFEYTWYGQFDLSAEAYEMLRNDFSTFKNELRR
ncbi:MAG: DUF4129 domain-containing protein [Bacteroidota bacterium]|nr:DUF4129 domain-containing protein [Bacteroidota bacterium]